MTKLRPFQNEGVHQIYDFGGKALLADEQGLGKTIQALAWVMKIPRRRPVIIVTPASVKYTWQSEAADHFGLRSTVLEGRCPRPGKALSGDIIILNYDILASWLPSLLRLRPQVVIFDECQFIKNLRASRTRASKRLARKAASILALSGTPLTNRPIELWSVLSIIRKDIFPERLTFAWRYCEPKHTRWGWKFDGAVRLPELHRILKSECMIRRLKKDVAQELPDKIHKVVPFKLKSYDEYNRAKNHFLRWLKEQSLSKALKAKKSQALTKVGYLLRLCAQLKLEWTVKWLEEFAEANPGEKLVGLTMHTFVIDHLLQKFPGAVIIDGRVTGRRRVETVRQFQSNKKVQFLFGNWKAAGLGLTLTASHTLVSFDFPWTAGDLAQGQDRVHRIGQKKKVIIYYFVLLHTIEMNLMKGLQKKKAVLDAILDGKGKSEDFDIYDVLIKELRYG